LRDWHSTRRRNISAQNCRAYNQNSKPLTMNEHYIFNYLLFAPTVKTLMHPVPPKPSPAKIRAGTAQGAPLLAAFSQVAGACITPTTGGPS